jgi:hypothetical protein
MMVMPPLTKVAKLRRPGEGRLSDPAEGLVARHGRVGIDAGEVNHVLAGGEVGDQVARGTGRAVGHFFEEPRVAPTAAGQGVLAGLALKLVAQRIALERVVLAGALKS